MFALNSITSSKLHTLLGVFAVFGGQLTLQSEHKQLV